MAVRTILTLTAQPTCASASQLKEKGKVVVHFPNTSIEVPNRTLSAGFQQCNHIASRRIQTQVETD